MSVTSGVILDEPLAPALLRLGYEAGLVTCSGNPYTYLKSELAKGLSPTVRERALLALVLFDDVVIPGDKALEDVGIDWGGLSDEGALRVASWTPKDFIREESMRVWLPFIDLRPDTYSGWDRILRRYLSTRKKLDPIVMGLVDSTPEIHSDISRITSVGTLEERVLYVTDAIEARIKRAVDNVPESLRRPEVGYEDFVRAIFWTFESYFHLRYLQWLATEPGMPDLVWTSLGRREISPVNPTTLGEIDQESEWVYSIYLDEIRTLPRPRTIVDALELRRDPLVRGFREHFHGWRSAVSAGDWAQEQDLRAELREISDRFERLGTYLAVSKIATYTGLPMGVVATLASGDPTLTIGGLAVSAIGFASQAWADFRSRADRWTLLGHV